MAANMFLENIIHRKKGNPMDEATDQPPREHNGCGTGQPPRECRSEFLDAFKKAPSPSGATVSHQ